MSAFLPSGIVPFAILTLLVPSMSSRTDEGMWLFNAPPAKLLKEKYQFSPGQDWYDHIQRSSVRFNLGGSGSFISADGLVITNHHVGSDALEKFSTPDHNLLKEGFYAATPAQEKPCYDLELNVLDSIQDITARVNAAVKPEASAQEAFQARRKVMAEIEKGSLDKTGLRSNVITLHQGGSYQLYRYKRYTDVRLVFAPEQQIAFYGGDPDNFEYPRYDLDICIFRVYENGKPVHPSDYLKFSTQGLSDNELVFVSGNPGSTQREKTVSQFAAARDIELPFMQSVLDRREVAVAAFSARRPEYALQAREELFSLRNSRKVCDGRVAGLLDREFFGMLEQREANLKAKFQENPKFQSALDAFARINETQKEISAQLIKFQLLEGDLHHGPPGFDSELFKAARVLYRHATEQTKSNGERLYEYQDGNKASLEFALFSEAPIHNDLEKVTLADSLTDLAGHLGADDPLVKQILAGKSPRERAAELVSHCTLASVQARKDLYKASPETLKASTDPMIALAALVDPAARELRAAHDGQVETLRRCYSQIAAARYAAGDESYSDATFTLRLSFGPVAGYEEDGKQVPAFTEIGGLFQRAAEHENLPPFDIPPRWMKSKNQLDPNVPFNFVCKVDIVGGSSGSPVINRAGEFVGIVFDGNIQTLVWDYAYSEKQARTVAVDSRAIVEALKKVYHAPGLLQEITTGKSSSPAAGGSTGAAATH
jgi:hypothetical protein